MKTAHSPDRMSPAANAAPSATGKGHPKPAVAPPPAELFWLTPGSTWEKTPAAIRQAVVNLILPAYRTLVADCPDPIERSAGISLVHLMWLEVCQQHKLGETVATPDSILATVARPAEQIAGHLNLLERKQRLTELLFKSRTTRTMIEKAKAQPLVDPYSPQVSPLWTMFPMAAPQDAARTGDAPAEPNETTNQTNHTNDTQSAARKGTVEH